VYTVMVQVQPGDILESVDGMRVHGWKMADILRMIVGEDDSFVTLGITRGQEV
jgi:C-terminal processing protease CtpA/Prc